MMKLGNNKTLLFIAIAAVTIWMIFGNQQQVKKSTYTLGGGYAPSDLEGTGIDVSSACAQNGGVGLASSLLPREVASQEDFGEFAPDDILKGQNFLDPRQQIGFPETMGGTLRNANQQIRADPPNPKQAFTWNNSTIVPDLMQRKMCS
tara:strand:+ start:309 stop:752 length:444 start_codon:yes stop_codon:yes gene_type:complete